jgi:hypothetical protein
MSAFFSIEFLGSYNNLQEFMNNKEWKYEMKKVANNKAFIKVAEDLVEELQFFNNSEINDSGEKITKVYFIHIDFPN